jgi:hypothetical protein
MSHGWGKFGTFQWDWDLSALSAGLGSCQWDWDSEAQSQLFLATRPLSIPCEIPHESEVKGEIHGPAYSHTPVPPDWDSSTSIHAVCRPVPNPFLPTLNFHTPLFYPPPPPPRLESEYLTSRARSSRASSPQPQVASPYDVLPRPPSLIEPPAYHPPPAVATLPPRTSDYSPPYTHSDSCAPSSSKHPAPSSSSSQPIDTENVHLGPFLGTLLLTTRRYFPAKRLLPAHRSRLVRALHP